MFGGFLMTYVAGYDSGQTDLFNTMVLNISNFIEYLSSIKSSISDPEK
jgi:hypothetical protein